MEKFANLEYAQILQRKLGTEYAVIKNDENMFPDFDLVPLAPKITKPVYMLNALLMGLEGTTITSKPLSLHALEHMIRVMSGKFSNDEWRGLDATIDIPHIIGYGVKSHVEFLVKRYANFLDEHYTTKAFLDTVAFTYLSGNKKRREELNSHLDQFGVSEISGYCARYMKEAGEKKNRTQLSRLLEEKYKEKLSIKGFYKMAMAGLDIFFSSYYEILYRAGSKDKEYKLYTRGNIVEPMPALEILLPLVKGWLGDEAGNLSERLTETLPAKKSNIAGNINPKTLSEKLNNLSVKFGANQLKTAIVTSSGKFETNIFLSELMKRLVELTGEMNLSDQKKEFIINKYTKINNCYNAVVTRDDSSEYRVKPHRDLFSIAMKKMNVTKEMFDSVMGIEDTEHGTIAIRAAGAGLCIAMPFAEKSGHEYTAASWVADGGIPDLLISKNLFLQ